MHTANKVVFYFEIYRKILSPVALLIVLLAVFHPSFGFPLQAWTVGCFWRM